MRLLCVIVLLIIFCSTQLIACDVNLLAIVSGKRPSNVFTNNIGSLIKDVRNVGQNVFEKEKSSKYLKTLMLSWVQFDTKYTQFPPTWASDDKNWKAKIKTIANQIGTVKKLLSKNHEVEAHASILSISRKITGLLEYMPMSPKEKLLLCFPAKFDMFCDALKNKNNKTLGLIISELVVEKNHLRKVIGSSTIPITDEFSSWIDSLATTYKKNAKSVNSKLKLSIGFTEAAFNEMNAKLKDAYN